MGSCLESTTHAVFVLKMLTENYRDGQRELHRVFVGVEEAKDRVLCEGVKSGVYVRVVQDMSESCKTVEFKVEVRSASRIKSEPLLVWSGDGQTDRRG